MPPSFLAVGELMLDLDVERGPHPHAGAISVRVGGSAANAAVWAVAAGAAALAVRAALAERSVEPWLTTDPEAPTGTVARVRGELIVDRGANARLATVDLPELTGIDALLVSGYALFHDDTAPAARAALEATATWRAVDCGAVGLLDGGALERATGANALFANEQEAAFLVPGAAEEAARRLGERFRLVCVKLGAAGAIGVLDGELVRVAAAQVHTGAARGAGDAFAAAVLVELARGGDVARAVRAGCTLGAAAAASPDGWPIR